MHVEHAKSCHYAFPAVSPPRKPLTCTFVPRHAPEPRLAAELRTHVFADTLRDRGIGFSLGFSVDENVQQAILALPEQAWTPAYDAGGEPRRGAWVAEITGLLDLSSWPAGSRVIVRRERPHPGAQLTFSDIDGHRFTAFLTDTPRGVMPRQLA